MIHTKIVKIIPGTLRCRAELFKALSSPARLAIVLALAEREHSVNELVDMLAGLACPCSVERTNISKHLAILREAGIVSRAGHGTQRIYRLERPALADIIREAT